MTEHPITFSAPMVRAILDGRKTQTRRLIKPQPTRSEVAPHCENGWWMWRVWTPEHAKNGYPSIRIGDCRCRYGVPGDRLWVRERHRFLDVTKSALSQFPLGPQNNNELGPDMWLVTVEYSDGTQHEDISVEGAKPKQTRERGEDKWRPSIHMHRWASRLTLEVTGVRVERLQEISVQDCIDEGVTEWATKQPHGGRDVLDGRARGIPYLKNAYAELWDSISGKRAPWASNPWVWVVEFGRAPA